MAAAIPIWCRPTPPTIPPGVGTVDVVLFCVKLWDVESAGLAIKPLVGPDTAVIPLQNGIDAAERLIPILGDNAVMGGVAQISASITAPGTVTQVGTFMRMIFGELNGKRSSERAEDFLALCQKAGFDALLSAQILTDLWMKFVLLATNASVTALARQPIGKLRDDPEIRPVFIAAHQEVIDVGRAKGVALPPNALDIILEFNSHAAARDESVDGARSRSASSRPEIALARRQGRGARPPAWRSDADAQPDVCDAQTLHHGRAGLSHSQGARLKGAACRRW